MSKHRTYFNSRSLKYETICQIEKNGIKKLVEHKLNKRPEYCPQCGLKINKDTIRKI